MLRGIDVVRAFGVEDLFVRQHLEHLRKNMTVRCFCVARLGVCIAWLDVALAGVLEHVGSNAVGHFLVGVLGMSVHWRCRYSSVCNRSSRGVHWANGVAGMGLQHS